MALRTPRTFRLLPPNARSLTPELSLPPAKLMYWGKNSQGFAVYIRRRDGARMVLIPRGASEGTASATGTHSTQGHDYLLDETEITRGQFHSFAPTRLSYWFARPGWPLGPTSPVDDLSWDDASGYCEWVGARSSEVVEPLLGRGVKELRIISAAWPARDRRGSDARGSEAAGAAGRGW